MKHYALSAFADAVIRRHVVEDTQADIINDILLVGAKPHYADLNMLSQNDEHYMHHIIEVGTQKGLKFGRNLKLKGCDYPRVDFLRAAGANLSTQMVVFCKIYYDPKFTRRRQVIDSTQIRQSPLAFVEGIWHDNLLETNARYAVNVHKNELELPTDLINRPPFVPVLTSKVCDLQFDFLMRQSVH